MEEYYLITFDSTHGAIATEKVLKPIGCVIMPVPRVISASCGISVRIKPENHEAAEAAFKETGVYRDRQFRYYFMTNNKATKEMTADPIEI